MKWSLVVKTFAPAEGTYRDWKTALAEEAGRRCVYCAIHEGSFGGYRNFHVEHFRPKSRFPNLENVYANLFYACAICNAFKGDDWPTGRQGLGLACYPDPSRTHYGILLKVSPQSGRVRGRNRAGRYVCERLFLNRPQLIMQRRVHSIERALERETRAIERLKERASRALLKEVIDSLAASVRVMTRLTETRPYGPTDVQR